MHFVYPFGRSLMRAVVIFLCHEQKGKRMKVSVCVDDALLALWLHTQSLFHLALGAMECANELCYSLCWLSVRTVGGLLSFYKCDLGPWGESHTTLYIRAGTNVEFGIRSFICCSIMYVLQYNF